MLKNLRSFGTGVARVCELAMMPAKRNFPHIPQQRGKADTSHRALMMNYYNFPDKLYDFSLPSRLVVVIGEL